jgi:putative two-component system protein, hydrogenase maturation factor HypX/HoxX
VYEARELAEMSRDLYADRSGFAAARHDFVHKVKPAATPARLLPPAVVKAAPKSRRTATLRPAVPVSA